VGLFDVGLSVVGSCPERQGRHHKKKTSTNGMLAGMKKKQRIAVMLPIEYRGGSLAGAKLIAKALYLGAKQVGDPVEIVFSHLDLEHVYSENDFADLPVDIQRRPFVWRHMASQKVKTASIYVGQPDDKVEGVYQYPDDGMNAFHDCDLLLIISDRLPLPLPPFYRYANVVYDYIQRYIKFLDPAKSQSYINAVKNSVGVITTTKFTASDAMVYAGISQSFVRTLPPLVPQVQKLASPPEGRGSYFVWPTNPAKHKNHMAALDAISIYYHRYGGTEDCYITGPNTDLLTVDDPSLEYLAAFRTELKSDRILRRKIKILGDMREYQYRKLVQDARFVFHPVIVDNGTFSVIEAAALGVPSVSSDYPAMRELCEATNVHPIWADPRSSEDMALALNTMMLDREEMAQRTAQHRANSFTPESLGVEYWTAVRDILLSLPEDRHEPALTQARLSRSLKNSEAEERTRHSLPSIFHTP
jgi:glycosyltransferase involved in cell wall biosynthesis